MHMYRIEPTYQYFALSHCSLHRVDAPLGTAEQMPSFALIAKQMSVFALIANVRARLPSASAAPQSASGLSRSLEPLAQCVAEDERQALDLLHHRVEVEGVALQVGREDRLAARKLHVLLLEDRLGLVTATPHSHALSVSYDCGDGIRFVQCVFGGVSLLPAAWGGVGTHAPRSPVCRLESSHTSARAPRPAG